MNLIADYITPAKIRACLAPPDSPPILSPASSPAWTRIFGRPDLSHVLDGIVRRAWTELDAPLPALTDELYREFHEHGTRDAFQKPYFERRRRLGRAGVALLASGSATERSAFARSLVAKLDAVLGEESWALPAHVASPDGRDPWCIDLASAKTAYLVAENLAVFQEFIPVGTQTSVRSRLREYFFEHYIAGADDFFWASRGGNWNAVCHYGVLGAALALEQDLDLVAALLDSARPRLARFLDGFTDDGGCAEGIGLWSRGFGAFSALNEILEIRTGGALSLFTGSERVKHISRHGPSLCLADGRVVNFADARDEPVSDWLLAYLGLRLQDDACRRQAVDNFHRLYRDPARPVDFDAPHATFSHWQRVFRHSTSVSNRIPATPVRPDVFLSSLGVWIARGVDADGVLWELAAKAGHNDEHHNHNDVGSFILNLSGVPFITEIGAPEYVKGYFDPRTRYTYLAARSLGHSLPVINGQEQAAGPRFAGTIVRAELDAGTVSFEAELHNAYSDAAKLKSFARRLTLDKEAGELRWEDRVETLEPVTIESALVTDADSVRLISPDLALIEKQGRVLRLVATDDGQWSRIEHHEYRDHCSRDASLSRLILRPRSPGARTTHTLSVSLRLQPA